MVGLWCGVGNGPGDGDEGPGDESVSDAVPSDVDLRDDEAVFEEFGPAEVLVAEGRGVEVGGFRGFQEADFADVVLDGFGDGLLVFHLETDARGVVGR